MSVFRSIGEVMKVDEVLRNVGEVMCNESIGEVEERVERVEVLRNGEVMCNLEKANRCEFCKAVLVYLTEEWEFDEISYPTLQYPIQYLVKRDIGRSRL